MIKRISIITIIATICIVVILMFTNLNAELIPSYFFDAKFSESTKIITSEISLKDIVALSGNLLLIMMKILLKLFTNREMIIYP